MQHDEPPRTGESGAPVTALLVDLDDTLIDDRQAMARGVLALRQGRWLALDQDDRVLTQRWDCIGRSLWAELSAGRTTMQAQRRQRLRRTFELALTDAQADELFDEYLGHYELHWAQFPGTPAFLAATAHLPRVIVTNGRRSLATRKLRALGLEHHFQAVVTPDDCGHRKPDPRMFMHALDRLSATPGTTLMVGDSLQSDIAPAAALGMRVFHVRADEGRPIERAAAAMSIAATCSPSHA